MNEPLSDGTQEQPRRHYSWPWFVLAAVLLGIVLAILWMNHEIQRTKRNRDLNSPARQVGSKAVFYACLKGVRNQRG